ncbi:hypothetical protein D9619_000126 [Psilocybe cf. subviscida]|uniref:Uncharacterized protein n=1 Tax=Psilocybe cf. subviscida TaxID=2480587 RepID=A0A8H5BF85_9AGAR|nr:hypothetical protein D9619_000126 [Psilocybe cf. subviscida]
MQVFKQALSVLTTLLLLELRVYALAIPIPQNQGASELKQPENSHYQQEPHHEYGGNSRPMPIGDAFVRYGFRRDFNQERSNPIGDALIGYGRESNSKESDLPVGDIHPNTEHFKDVVDRALFRYSQGR